MLNLEHLENAFATGVPIGHQGQDPGARRLLVRFVSWDEPWRMRHVLADRQATASSASHQHVTNLSLLSQFHPQGETQSGHDLD